MSLSLRRLRGALSLAQRESEVVGELTLRAAALTQTLAPLGSRAPLHYDAAVSPQSLRFASRPRRTDHVSTSCKSL